MKTNLMKVILGMATLIMTLEVQATRYAPNAVKVDFVSIGAGRNTIAYSAIKHILELADSSNHLGTVNEIQIGFEGHTKMCANFTDLKAYNSYAMAIARVAVLSEDKWRATLFEPVIGDCSDDQTKSETNNQLGPFASNAEASLVCKAIIKGNNPDNYQASLELFEGYRHKSAHINVKLKQSSRRARYKVVEWKVDEATVSESGDIKYTSSSQGDLVLIPTTSASGLKYLVNYNDLEFECE